MIVLFSSIGYLNKLLDGYNNAYHCSIGKKPTDANYSTLTEKIETNPKAFKFTVGDRVRITKYKNIFCKSYAAKWSQETFVTDSVIKTYHCTYKNVTKRIK